jgi:hypothetical protein
MRVEPELLRPLGCLIRPGLVEPVELDALRVAPCPAVVVRIGVEPDDNVKLWVLRGGTLAKR